METAVTWQQASNCCFCMAYGFACQMPEIIPSYKNANKI